jgi:hypothetical protein
MVTWLLEREVFADEDRGLAMAAEAAGDRVVSWRDDWWLDGRWPNLGTEPVVFHGSLGNADRVHRERSWLPGAYCSTDNFACSSWWPEVAAELVADRYVFSTVSALATAGPPAELGDRVFVRPDSPLKPFSGRVLERDRITLQTLDHGFYYDDEDLPVMVMPAIEIGEEWRLIVADGRIVTGSGYLADGRQGSEPIGPAHPAWAYASSLLGRVSTPDRIFVLDVCETNAGLRLLELNPFSGADLYGSDRHAIVESVRAMLA